MSETLLGEVTTFCVGLCLCSLVGLLGIVALDGTCTFLAVLVVDGVDNPLLVVVVVYAVPQLDLGTNSDVAVLEVETVGRVVPLDVVESDTVKGDKVEHLVTVALVASPELGGGSVALYAVLDVCTDVVGNVLELARVGRVLEDGVVFVAALEDETRAVVARLGGEAEVVVGVRLDLVLCPFLGVSKR